MYIYINVMPSCISTLSVNCVSANPAKCSGTLKQFVGKLPTSFLSVFEYFVGLALRGLISVITSIAMIS